MKKYYLFTKIFVLFSILQTFSQTTNIQSYNTLIKSNHNFGLTNPLWDQSCLMTYDANPTLINSNGAAFQFTFNNPGGTGFKGYPSGTVGGFKVGNNYYPSNETASGFPIKIMDLNKNLRINWKPYCNFGNDSEDKWWATINVIFDHTDVTLAPNQDDRDYDLVIQLKSYLQDDFTDLPQNDAAYWYFARNNDGTLKTYDINLNGSIYKFAVRYKFFNYPPGNINEDKNDKVHVKFIPIDNNNSIPFLDHSLKDFIDTSKNYLDYITITNSERTLANQKVADSNLWIKSIAGGFEVYTGSFTIGNDFFYTLKDTINPPPSTLTGTLLSNAIKLNWGASSASDFNKYLIYKSVNNGPFNLIPGNIQSNTFMDYSINSGSNYRYYVVVQDRSFNVSSNSNTITITTPTATNSYQMVQRMGRGINVGNILSAPIEGDWAPALTEQYIDDIYALRFKTVRIPIRFDNQTTPFTNVTYTDGNGNYIGSPSQYTVNTNYLDRIEQIIDWCLVRNMIPIIDVHGDHWFWESFDSQSSYYATGNDRLARIDRFKAIWRDISVRFQSKNENLLFEIMNEPFFSMSAVEVADINTQILALIRQTNPTRNVIITGGSQNSHLAPLQIPSSLAQSEPYLIATYHYYQPRAFTASASQAQTDNDWGTAADKSQIDSHFDMVKNWSVSNNIPIYMGEYGADNEGGYNYSSSTYGLYGGPDVVSRRLYYEYVGNAAIERGFSMSAWDAGEEAGKTIYLVSSRNWVKDVRNAVLNKTCSSSGIIKNADVECNYDYDWSLQLNNGSTAFLYNAYENESNNQTVSLKLNVSQTSGTANNVILTNSDATTNFTVGNTYSFECFAKASTASQSFRIRIKAIVNGVTTNFTSSAFNLTTNYTNYQYNMTVPANTTVLTFQVLCGATVGTYYFDDFKMSDSYTCPISSTWNGSSWSNGVPSINTEAIFNGNYNSTSNLSACKVTVTNNFTVRFNAGHTLTVANNIQVNNTGNLIIESDAAVLQESKQSNIGSIQVKRNSTPMVRLDYTKWSSPVTNQQLLAFSPQTLTNRFYTYLYNSTSTPTSYLNINPNTNFLPTKGYYIRVANNWSDTVPTIFNGIFRGNLNNGDYTNFTGKGYNLVGNPYPSPMNATIFMTENTNVNTLYFWTHSSPSIGNSYPVNNYASYTTLGGTAAEAGGQIPNGFIQTGQGFFVNTLNSNPIYFKNTQRTNAAASTQFFKANTTNEKQLIRLDFKKENQPYNQILIGFSEESTDGFDNTIDGVLFNNQTNCLYTLIENKEGNYVIQGKNYPLNLNQSFKIGYNVLEESLLTLSINSIENIALNQPIYLYDKDLNIYTDLKQTEYTFYSSIGRFEDRFEIVFKKSDSLINSNTLIFQEKNKIKISNQSQKIDQIQVFDVLGKLLFFKEKCNSNLVEFNSINHQILLIKISFETGFIENHKLLSN